MMSDPDPGSSSAARSMLRIAAPVILIVALASLGVGVWWMNRDLVNPMAGVTTTPVKTGNEAAGSVDQGEELLGRARLALNERRLLAPAGDNAVEYYLQAQEDETTYSTARLALLELIAPATGAVEGSIAAADLGEAQRQFELLRRMGASELSLSPLREQMQAAQLQIDRARALAEEQAAALEQAALAAAAPPTAAVPAETAAATAQAPQTSEAPPPIASQPPARPSAPPTATTAPDTTPPATPIQVPAPTEAVAETTPAVAAERIVEPRQVVDVRPNYPPSAVQRRIEGWVELEIEINAAGEVQGVTVVGSEPARIFDREATRAAQRWRFEPRRENGVAVAARVRKTLTFKLGSG